MFSYDNRDSLDTIVGADGGYLSDIHNWVTLNNPRITWQKKTPAVKNIMLDYQIKSETIMLTYAWGGAISVYDEAGWLLLMNSHKMKVKEIQHSVTEINFNNH